LGKDVRTLNEDWANSYDGVIQSFERLKTASSSSFVNKAVTDLLDANSNLAYEEAQAMQVAFQKAFAKGGTTALGKMQELFADEAANKIDDILNDFDW